jgi:hypothetical protein
MNIKNYVLDFLTILFVIAVGCIFIWEMCFPQKTQTVVANQFVTKNCQQIDGEIVCTATITFPKNVDHVEVAVIEVGSNKMHFIREVRGYTTNGIKFHIK